MKVAILDDWLDVARSLAPWDRLAGVEVVAIQGHLSSRQRLVETLRPFEVVAVMRERTALPRPVLERLPNLQLVVTSGMRNASIDLHAAADLGVLVSGTGGNPADTPELAWGLVLALARDLPAQDRSVRDGRWQTHLGMSLAGKRLGLLGLGTIGQRMARYAQAFDMEVVAWSSTLTPERAEASSVTYLAKEELLRTSDVISIHLRLGERSRGLIGADELSMMKQTALLINTSRGPIIDEGALIRALTDGDIGGAALDVFDEEPIPADHPFTRLPNVVLSPHLGYATRDGFERYYREMVEDIDAFLAGAPIRLLRPE